MMSKYFAYGSNMNFGQMIARCPGAVLTGQASLRGWSYFINSNGYAGIERSNDQIVHGCLWNLKKYHWTLLDRYESVDAGYYSREKVEVQINPTKSKEVVWIYLSNDLTHGRPTLSYQRLVVQGARQNCLPTQYIENLESWLHFE